MLIIVSLLIIYAFLLSFCCEFALIIYRFIISESIINRLSIIRLMLLMKLLL